jgi:hypothetical protein
VLQFFLYNYRETAGWVARVCDRMRVHANDTPLFSLDRLREAFSSLFHPHEEKVCPYHPPATDEIVTERAMSWSYITILPPDEKAKFVEDVKGILERGDGKVWINKEEGTYQYPYKTRVVVSRKK